MTIRSEPLKDDKPASQTASQPAERARGILRPPLSRTDLDRSAPWLRLFVGLLLIAVSTYTTILGVGRDFAPLLQGTIAGVSVVIIAGAAAAALLTLGEWLTGERVPLVYAILLFLDARYTQMQIAPWVDTLAAYHLRTAAPWIANVVAFAASWGSAFAVARYGEVLLLGKRRRE